MSACVDSAAVSPRNGVQVFCDFKDTQSFRRELLYSISNHVPPSDVSAISLHERYVNFYFTQFDHVRTLLKEGLNVRGSRCEVLHLYNVFNAYNVTPTLTHPEITNQLNAYGHVEEILKLPFCGNDPRFLHIIGNERRIFVETTLKRNNLAPIPSELKCTFGQAIDDPVIIRSYCMLCEDEGHTTNECKFRWTPSEHWADDLRIQEDNNDSIDSGDSPIYLPDDAFQCINTEAGTNGAEVALEEVAEQSVLTQSLPGPSVHLEKSHSPCSSVDSSATSLQQRLSSTTDSAYSSIVSPERPSSLDSGSSIKNQDVLPATKPQWYTLSQRGRPLKSGKQRVSLRMNKPNVRSGRKKMHKIWQHFHDTQFVFGKFNTRLVKCKYCGTDLIGRIPTLITHYHSCEKVS